MSHKNSDIRNLKTDKVIKTTNTVKLKPEVITNNQSNLSHLKSTVKKVKDNKQPKQIIKDNEIISNKKVKDTIKNKQTITKYEEKKY